MVTLHDIPGAAERLKAQADQLAHQIGVPNEIIYAYFNRYAHFPQSIAELEAFGNEVDPTYGVRRRSESGAWTPIMPGVTPGKSPTDPGFKHVITNNVDSQIEAFQQVNADGSLFGGSWSPEYNAAHPELAGQSGFGTSMAAAAAAPATGGERWNTMSGDGSGPSPQDIANAAALQDWQKRQVEQSNGWPVGSLGGGAGAAAPAAPSAPAAPGAAPSSGGGTFTTRNGPKTIQQMTDELRAAGYSGPTDDQSIVDTYARTTGQVTAPSGASSGAPSPGSQGLGPLLDGVGYKNTQDFELRKAETDAKIKDLLERLKLAQNDDQRAQILQDFNIQAAIDARYDKNRAGDLDRYSALSQSLLKNAVDLGSRPEDYFKYSQYLAGGKDIFAQLYGNAPRPAFSEPTGPIRSGTISGLMNQIGMPAAPNLPFQSNDPDPRVSARLAVPRIKAGYEAALKAAGVSYLSAGDPRLVAVFKTAGDLDDAGAAEVARKNADYFQANRTSVPDDVMAGFIADAKARRVAQAPPVQATPQAQTMAASAAGGASDEIDWTTGKRKAPAGQFANF